ncbi:hypothetical protein ACFL56_00605 [Candidatus Margulisiibacteriota bacterium]
MSEKKEVRRENLLRRARILFVDSYKIDFFHLEVDLFFGRGDRIRPFAPLWAAAPGQGILLTFAYAAWAA